MKLKFHTDDHFLIGHHHVISGKPCQDHSLSGIHDGVAYAIVSDGCSSGGHTDVGARIVTHTTATAIRKNWQSFLLSLDAAGFINDHQQSTMNAVKNKLQLETSDMLATCSYVAMSQETCVVNVRGDGVVAVIFRNGEMFLHRFDWTNNTPLYPAYSTDGYESFIKTHGGAYKQALRWETWNKSTGESFASELTVAAGIQGVTLNLSPEQVSFVAVFSDGVTQVEGVDWKDVVLQLLAFKGVEGVFVKRRLNAFVKDARKVGKGPLDDIAYAMVRVEHQEGDV